MKFANYTFYARGINNLGDNLQLIAVDSIFRRMGIPKEEIIYIDKNELSTYKGEYVVLPVTMPLVDYVEGGIAGRFSDYIIPVFLGLTLANDSLLQQEVDYYHRFEPIGCRDERTMNTLRSYGIQTYLHGCIAATFPRREVKGKEFSKVFIVDVAPELLSYIPDKLMKDAVFLTHFHNDVDDPKQLMQEYYNRYMNEARLVITSLLHCSVPCMAAGVPVVLAKQNISYRFGWLEKLLPLYEKNEFSNIDWDPIQVEYEEHKMRLLQISINRLRESYDKYKDIFELSWFYEEREKREYIVDAFESIKQYIDNHFKDQKIKYRYSIWGLSQAAVLAFNYISQRFPNAKLMHVYDSYRKIQFEGLTSVSPEEIRKNPDEIILVTTIGAKEMAQSLFGEIGKEKDSYVIFEPIK